MIWQTKQLVLLLIVLANAGATIGYAVTAALDQIVVIPGSGTTSVFNGYLKGIVTGVTTDSTNSASTVDVKIVSRVSVLEQKQQITYEEGTELGII